MAVTFQIELSEPEAEALLVEARRRGLTVADLLRDLIRSGQVRPETEMTADEYDSDPIWSIVGAVDTGTVDGAENHDAYIYSKDD